MSDGDEPENVAEHKPVRHPERETDCKYCGARIRFVMTEKRVAMPCEATPKRLMVEVGETGVYSVRSCYVPHWGNCSGADKFRKAKR